MQSLQDQRQHGVLHGLHGTSARHITAQHSTAHHRDSAGALQSCIGPNGIGVLSIFAGEALPWGPGSRVRPIALCVASRWESAPLVTQKKQAKKHEELLRLLKQLAEQSLCGCHKDAVF